MSNYSELGMYEVDLGTIILPGTSVFLRRTDEQEDSAIDRVLVPQPSNDINDPLNWEKSTKQTILWVVAITASLVHTLGPMVTTSFRQVAHEYHQSTDAVALALSGEFHLMIGIGTLLTSAFGVTYGKRPAFLLATVLLVITTLWVYFTTSFVSLGVARAIEGFASAPFEVLSNGIIVDVFFVHERGLALAVVGSWALLALLLGQVGGGFVVQYLGWRKLFLIATVVISVTLPVIFFMLPETTYNRTKISLTTSGSESTKEKYVWTTEHNSRLPTSQQVNKAHLLPDGDRRPTPSNDCLSSVSAVSTASNDSGTELVKSSTKSEMTPKPAFSRLRIWNGKVSTEPYWKGVLRPVSLLIYPAVIFGIFIHGLGSTWLHAFALAKLQLFTRAPYHLTPSQIGLTTLAGAVAGTLAHPLAGWTSDRLARSMSRRNKGVYEAEFRLILMLPQCLFSVAGFIGFGVSVQHGRPLSVVLIFYALVAFSVPFGSMASTTYLLDSMERRNQEAMVGIILLKNVFILFFASFINGWIEARGPQTVFMSLGLLNFGISLLTIPFYVFGKKMRLFVLQHRFLKNLDNM